MCSETAVSLLARQRLLNTLVKTNLTLTGSGGWCGRKHMAACTLASQPKGFQHHAAQDQIVKDSHAASGQLSKRIGIYTIRSQMTTADGCKIETPDFFPSAVYYYYSMDPLACCRWGKSLSVWPSVQPSDCKCVYPTVSPSLRTSVWQSGHPSIRPSVHPFTCHVVHATISLSVRPSVHLTVMLSDHPTDCPSGAFTDTAC